MGYWNSKDLLNWQFVTPERWYFQGSNAPAAFNYKDSVLYVMGDPSGSMSVLYTDNPKKGDWKATPSILNNLQDPALFIDDNDSSYIFWGSSNKFPIRGRTLTKAQSFKPGEKIHELFNLDMEKHGWERFGENHEDTVLGGYIEGPWMLKHNKKYYLLYAAPGTQWNVYADGVYTADQPLGPYTYAPNNPVFYKPGGFMNGAGHGSIVVGPGEVLWHFGSNALSVNVNWERRITMQASFIDNDGLLFADNYFGDYPHYAPAIPGKQGKFTGWMLLSYNKPVTASSFVDDHQPKHVNNESVKNFWLAEANDAKQWLQIDLQKASTVRAIQVNFHDYKSGMYGRIKDLHHRYTIQGSADGKTWITLVDRAGSFEDVPNDYVEMTTPASVRYIRYNNIKVPTPHLAISGLRVFGTGNGKVPADVKSFTVTRKSDRRDALIRWDVVPGAQGYNIIWGIAPDKLYNSWMVYGKNELLLKSLTVNQQYYFTIEAFNENGISKRYRAVKVD